MDTKQVIVIRKDLKMRRGKEIAQACHAAMAFLTREAKINMGSFYGEMHNIITSTESDWLHNSFTKVCVCVDSEEELLEIEKKAGLEEVQCYVVTDSGKTEFNGVPTRTCLALGPDKSWVIDQITGHLRLY